MSFLSCFTRGAPVFVAMAIMMTCASAQALPDPAMTPASDAVAAASSPIANDFDARQKAIDRRSAQNNYQYELARHNCYSKFFVNHCLNRAHDKMRAVQAGIRQDQLALGEQERVDHAQRRDAQAALQRAQNAAQAPQREANEAKNAQAYADKQRQHALDAAQNAADAPQRVASEQRNAQAYDEKQRQHVLSAAERGDATHRAVAQSALAQPGFQQKLAAARQRGAQKAQQRAQNVTKYQKKQAAAAQRKADVEHRQQQAAEKRQKQQQQQQQQQH